jgi:dTDP-4-amino-4,6-dideoxygalactose transaminase
MTDTQARVGRLRARSFAAGTAYRRNLQTLYRDLLPGAGFDPGPDVPGTVLSRYPVRVTEKAAVLAAASRRGLELGSWFETPLHPAPLLRHSDLGYAPGSCPHAERAAREVVNLPVNERTRDVDARRVVAFLATTARPA